jgi:hypothetical protein
MAEAIGVVLGVAGLFSACLDCLDLVDRARNYEHESEVLIAKLDIQRVRLQIWGSEVYRAYKMMMCWSLLRKLPLMTTQVADLTILSTRSWSLLT